MGTVRFGGVTMASVYGFRITVTGKGGHGSTPENCVDPIVAAIKIHEALETLMSREKSPFAEAAQPMQRLHGSGTPAAAAVRLSAVVY